MGATSGDDKAQDAKLPGESHGREEAETSLALLDTLGTGGPFAASRLAAGPLLQRPSGWCSLALGLGALVHLPSLWISSYSLFPVLRLVVSPISLVIEAMVVATWLQQAYDPERRRFPAPGLHALLPFAIVGFGFSVIEMAMYATLGRWLPVSAMMVVPRLYLMAAHWYFLNVLRAILVERHGFPLAMGIGLLTSFRLERLRTALPALGVMALGLTGLQVANAVMVRVLGPEVWSVPFPVSVLLWWIVSGAAWLVVRWHFDLTWLTLELGTRSPELGAAHPPPDQPAPRLPAA